MNWLRWYVGTCTDAKLHRAATLAGVRRYLMIAAWAAVLEEARRNGDDGEVPCVCPTWLASQIGARTDACERALKGMVEVGLIANSCVSAFKKRQFSSDSSTLRVRRHRAKILKEKETPPTGNVTETPYQNRTEQNRIEKEPKQAPKRASPNGSVGPPLTDPRGSRLKEDWEPGEAGIDYARKLGMSADAINATYASFMRYWLAKAGKDARKVSWDLTWQTWVRREHERLREQTAREQIWRDRRGAAH